MKIKRKLELLADAECIVVSGPKACGKTRNADRLRQMWGCSRVLEFDENGGHMPQDGKVLVLTYEPLKVFDGLKRAVLLSFEHAMLGA